MAGHTRSTSIALFLLAAAFAVRAYAGPGGACCLDDGSCYVTTAGDCTIIAGAYQGDGTDCASVTCAAPAVGACCFSDGGCQETTQTFCAAVGGSYQGDGSTCTPNPCPPLPPLTGACCVGSICTEMTEADCSTAGGFYVGDETTCTPDVCPPFVVADTNCDGIVDFFDIDPYIQILFDPVGYDLVYPDCDPISGDANHDGSVDLFDTDPFLSCLFASGAGNPLPCGLEVRRPNYCVSLGNLISPVGGGPYRVGRAEISLPNVVREGTPPPGELRFPGVPGEVLSADGLADSLTGGAPFQITGKDLLPGYDLRAVVRYPATANGTGTPAAGTTERFPLVVFAHGNHKRYAGVVQNFGLPDIPGRARNRIDPRDENYRGYLYLQDLLATHGYISISIDLDDFTFLFPGILARTWLTVCHLENLERIDGLAGNPFVGFTGNPLRNRINLDRIVLIGHSRGGEAVVRAQMMSETSGTGNPSLDGPPNGRGGAEGIWGIRAVWSIAATRFFDGTNVYDNLPNPALRRLAGSSVQVSNFGGTLATIPFLGLYGDADGDVSGGGRSHVEIIYDSSPAWPSQFVWMEGANHNFWNTSWFRNDGSATVAADFRATDFGDDGYDFVNVRDRVRRADPAEMLPPRPSGTRGNNDEIQQEIARIYGLAFVRGYVGAVADAQFRGYFQRPPTDAGLAGVPSGQRRFVHLQYQTPPPGYVLGQRIIVADFEDASPFADESHSATVNVIVAGATDGLIGAEDDTSPTHSFFHATKGMLFEWTPPAMGPPPFIKFDRAAPWNVRNFDVLSFRVAQDSRHADSIKPMEFEVTLIDGAGRSAFVSTAEATLIPPHQVRMDSTLLTKSMLKTVRLRLCLYRNSEPRLDLTNIDKIEIRFRRDGGAAAPNGKAAIDDIEFSK